MTAWRLGRACAFHSSVDLHDVRSSLPVLAASDTQIWMEEGYYQRKRPSPQREDEGRIRWLEIRLIPLQVASGPVKQCPLRAHLASQS